MKTIRYPYLLPCIGILMLAAFPTVATLLNEEFYITLASRILILALAASSLNLLLGYGGMISFGHAAFFGIGAYTVGILMFHGVDSAWISWPAAFIFSGLVAAALGWFCLRTHGVYFIMITLAFAQMLFFVFVSLKTYGGDDGLPLMTKSKIGLGLDISSDTGFYYAVLLIFVLSSLIISRLIDSRFGRVVQAIKTNETRMEAIGYSVKKYKLVCFVIAGAFCGLAGALMANQTGLVSPSLLNWSQSGQFMIMVILGGVGYRYGGFIGAAVLMVLEEVLSSYTIYWPLGVGLVLLAVVMLEEGGVSAIAQRIFSSKKKEVSNKEQSVETAS